MNDTKRKSISVDELFALEEQKVGNSSDKIDKKNYSKEKLQELKKENKFYLPVLNINEPVMWPSKPVSERDLLTDKKAEEVCLNKCCGEPGVHAACCRIDPDDVEHVLGPISEKWIKKIIKHFNKKGVRWKRADVVIDFEEGKMIGDKLFNGNSIFQKKEIYPILRMQIIGPRYGCKFLNPNDGRCSIYNLRPSICASYYCEYIKANFLVRTKANPNTYKRIDIGRKEGEDEL